MYGFTITNAGLPLLARAMAGEQLLIAGTVVGKGVPAEDPKELTALVEYVADATSSSPVVTEHNMSFLVEYRNDMNGGLEQGFFLSEYGVMARIGTEDPVLLYYGSLADRPQYIGPYTDGLEVCRYPVRIAATSELTVSLEYPAGAWMTAGDAAALLDAHNESSASHPDIREAVVYAQATADEALLAAGTGQTAHDALQQALDTHSSNKKNPHGVTAAQVGLGNADNTSDADKPISAATQAALNGKAATSHATTAATYGVGNASNYGHLKLSASTTSTSGVTGGLAATPSAVRAAYNLAASIPYVVAGTFTVTGYSECESVIGITARMLIFPPNQRMTENPKGSAVVSPGERWHPDRTSAYVGLSPDGTKVIGCGKLTSSSAWGTTVIGWIAIK